MERRRRQRPQQRQDTDGGVGLAGHVEDGDGADEQRDVDDEDDDQDDDLDDETTDVDDPRSAYADRHRRSDSGERQRADHAGSGLGGQERRVSEHDGGRRGAEAEAENGEPVLFVGVLETPPQVGDQAEDQRQGHRAHHRPSGVHDGRDDAGADDEYQRAVVRALPVSEESDTRARPGTLGARSRL